MSRPLLMHTEPGIDDGLAILKEPLGTIQSWEKDVCAKFESCFVRAKEIRKDPGAFILCLSYWDISNLIDIEPQDTNIRNVRETATSID